MARRKFFISKINTKIKLFKSNPKLINEWDYNKNKVNPESITHGSSKKAWWICYALHSWEAVISSRAKGHGCPFCSGRRTSIEKSILNTAPHLAKEWDYIKNDTLRPEQVSRGSTKNIWWICKDGHSWRTSANSRKGCPFCSGQKPTPQKNLYVCYPLLAKEWDFTKNSKGPKHFTKCSRYKVWWICKNNHSYEAAVYNRVKGKGCPYCSNRKVCKDNNLSVCYPNLVDEWDFNKNFDLSPHHVLPGTSQKVWWICKNNHSWRATLNSRTYGNGCPKCYGNISKKEIKWLNSIGILNRNITISIGSSYIRVDGYCHKTNTIYEFYGDYWHGNPKKFNANDINKSVKKTFGELYNSTKNREKLIKEAGFNLITIWENDFNLIAK